MKELFELLQEEYKTKKLLLYYTDYTTYRGLCYAVIVLYRADKINGLMRDSLIGKIKGYAKTLKRPLYTDEGDRTNNPNQFIWKAGNRQPRLKWLEKQIKLHE